MKHLTGVSKSVPVRANEWQDATCAMIRPIYNLIELKGANAPLLGWIDQKCTLPTE